MSKNEKIGILLFIIVITTSFLSIVLIEKNSETSKNLAIINEEFSNFATEEIMISNISHIRAKEIAADIRGIHGVNWNYRDTSALFVISFDGENILDEIKKMIGPYDVEIQENRIRERFGTNNTLQLIVPCGDYESEKQLLASLSRYVEVDRVIGLSNMETIGGYLLTDTLNPDEFSQLMELDYEVVSERAPLIDMVEFLYNQSKEGHIRLDNEYMAKLEKYHLKLNRFRGQMEGENYSRIFIELNLPIEGQETSEFISRIYSEASLYYDLESVFIVGESVTALERKGISFEKN